MKMKGQLNVATPAEYIAAVDDERRSDIEALDALIRRHAPTLEPVISGGMLGYGPFHHRSASGREGDACTLSVASNASYISLYCFAADAEGYVAERYVDRLPKASIGKSCVRFKRLADLGFEVLATQGTAEVLRRNGIAATVVRKHFEGTGPAGEPTTIQLIAAGEIQLVVNTPHGSASGGSPRIDGYEIRTAAVMANIPCITTVQGLGAAVQGIEALIEGNIGVRSLQDWALRDGLSTPSSGATRS